MGNENNDWKLVLEGTTIHGNHIHIYKNKEGLFDIKEEE